MRLLAWLLLLLMTVQLTGWAETSRRTMGDMYMESYSSATSKYLASGAGEIRAEAYRSRYEQCDADHNCSNRTAAAKESESQASRNRTEQDRTLVRHMPNLPVIQ